MDAETIQAIAALPVMGILIYLIVRQQAQIEKLNACIIEMVAQHARDMVSIISDRNGGMVHQGSNSASDRIG